MLRWAAKIITSKSSSCYHIDTNVTSPTPSHPPFTLSYQLLLLPHLCPQRYSKDLELLLDHGPQDTHTSYTTKGIHTTEVDSITVSGEATTMSSKIQVLNPWHAFGLVQSYKHQFAWLLVQVTWVTPKNDDRNVVTPNFAAERFSFEERELVDQELMQWVNQSKSNMSLNQSLGSQEKPAWIKNELKKHVPTNMFPMKGRMCSIIIHQNDIDHPRSVTSEIGFALRNPTLGTSACLGSSSKKLTSKQSPLEKVTILDLHYLVPPNAPSTHLSVECPRMSSRAAILSTMRPVAPSSNSCRTSLESVSWPRRHANVWMKRRMNTECDLQNESFDIIMSMR